MGNNGKALLLMIIATILIANYLESITTTTASLEKGKLITLAADGTALAPTPTPYLTDANTTQTANSTENQQDAIDLETLGRQSHPQLQNNPTPEPTETYIAEEPKWTPKPTIAEKTSSLTTIEPFKTDSPNPTARPSAESRITSDHIIYITPNWPSPAPVPTNSNQILAQEFMVSCIIVAIVSVASVVILKRHKKEN